MSLSTIGKQIDLTQVATVIKQLSRFEKRQLLNLVPELHQVAIQPPVRTPEQIQASIATATAEIMKDLNHQPISGDQPFLGGLSLNEYLALPDKEQAKIWDEAEEIDMMELEEMEVSPDVLLAR